MFQGYAHVFFTPAGACLPRIACARRTHASPDAVALNH